LEAFFIKSGQTMKLVKILIIFIGIGCLVFTGGRWFQHRRQEQGARIGNVLMEANFDLKNLPPDKDTAARLKTAIGTLQKIDVTDCPEHFRKCWADFTGQLGKIATAEAGSKDPKSGKLMEAVNAHGLSAVMGGFEVTEETRPLQEAFQALTKCYEEFGVN
jgi:hypothetical protein